MVSPADLQPAVEQAARQPVEEPGQQGGQRQRDEQAQPGQRVEGGEDPAPQLVLHVLLEDGEAEDVDGPRAHAHHGDERAWRRPRLDIDDAASMDAPAPSTARGKIRWWGRRFWSADSPTTPTARPMPEGGEQQAEAGRAGVEHLGGEDGPEGRDHPAADEPGAEADHHRPHDRAGADEPPALLELGERRR